MNRLEDRVAIVTGAAQGIGAAFALALAREGARVVVCDRADPGPTVAAIERAGEIAAGVVADVTRREDCERMVATAIARFGTVHVLVNNAAAFSILKRGSFLAIANEDWDAAMAVNVRGPFLCAKAVVPEMRRNRYGKIVNITTGMVLMGVPMFLHYVASKGALDGMTRALAREVGEDGIRVNAIAPGFTMSASMEAQRAELADTIDRTLANRTIKRDQLPADLVGAMLYLVSSESDFVIGQTLVVDGVYFMH